MNDDHFIVDFVSLTLGFMIGVAFFAALSVDAVNTSITSGRCHIVEQQVWCK